MRTIQQAEALHYFNSYATEWQRKALSQEEKRVNVIRQRNGFVLDVINNREHTRAALDVGCGSGDLVCAIARLGVTATGVDFAEEMIALARARAIDEALSNVSFHCASIFDYDFSGERYDVISANGFIEYISHAELDRLLDLSFDVLYPGGSLVLGSRNRLFNLFSLNDYTLEEVRRGTISHLLTEAIAFASGVALEEMMDVESVPLQDTDSQHAHTGIDVATRYQFTPLQLMKMLKAKGFVTRQIVPVHIHGVPPAFKQRHLEVHTSISNLLQSYAPDSPSLVPYASSFMIHATR